jgi:hypothetical protein
MCQQELKLSSIENISTSSTCHSLILLEQFVLFIFLYHFRCQDIVMRPEFFVVILNYGAVVVVRL